MDDYAGHKWTPDQADWDVPYNALCDGLATDMSTLFAALSGVASSSDSNVNIAGLVPGAVTFHIREARTAANFPIGAVFKAIPVDDLNGSIVVFDITAFNAGTGDLTGAAVSSIGAAAHASWIILPANAVPALGFGGASVPAALVADKTIGATDNKYQVLKTATNGVGIIFDDARKFGAGTDLFDIENDDTIPMPVWNSGKASVVGWAVKGLPLKVKLRDNTTLTGGWALRTSDRRANLGVFHLFSRFTGLQGVGLVDASTWNAPQTFVVSETVHVVLTMTATQGRVATLTYDPANGGWTVSANVTLNGGAALIGGGNGASAALCNGILYIAWVPNAAPAVNIQAYTPGVGLGAAATLAAVTPSSPGLDIAVAAVNGTDCQGIVSTVTSTGTGVVAGFSTTTATTITLSAAQALTASTAFASPCCVMLTDLVGAVGYKINTGYTVRQVSLTVASPPVLTLGTIERNLNSSTNDAISLAMATATTIAAFYIGASSNGTPLFGRVLTTGAADFSSLGTEVNFSGGDDLHFNSAMAGTEAIRISASRFLVINTDNSGAAPPSAILVSIVAGALKRFSAVFDLWDGPSSIFRNSSSATRLRHVPGANGKVLFLYQAFDPIGSASNTNNSRATMLALAEAA